MERLTYRITLEAYKNGLQRLLQGFHTGEKFARRLEITLKTGSDTYEIPTENVTAAMYITKPGATGPSINGCEIQGNTIIYDLLDTDTDTEGIAVCQVKLIMHDGSGDPRIVLLAPKFGMEILESDADDSEGEQTTTFTALEAALAQAQAAYNHSVASIMLDEETYILYVYYEDGSYYSTDAIALILEQLEADLDSVASAEQTVLEIRDELKNWAKLSESYAVGGTGTRVGEDTDNSKYYATEAQSAAAAAAASQTVIQSAVDLVNRKVAGAFFSVDYENGDLLYESEDYTFTINQQTGDLEYDQV